MSSKSLLPLLLILGWLGASANFDANAAAAESQPAGKLIELHSCEVYAGGCTVSSEAPQGGRYLLQVWDLASGSWQGVDLTGLKVALLEASSDNLADQGARPDNTVVYFSKGSSGAQQQALLSWLKSRDGKLASSSIQTRVVPISVVNSADGVNVTVGRFATLETTALGKCPNRACGEDLWYEPTIATDRFTVALDRDSQVNEPKLQLKWNDHGKRSVFVAHFGGDGAARNQFVDSAEWCGAIGRLF